MKLVESVRHIDNLGRIVIPKDIRKNLNIKPDDIISISILEEKIILKKHDLFGNLDFIIQSIFDSIMKVYNYECFLFDKSKVIIFPSIFKNKILDNNDLVLIDVKKKKYTFFQEIKLSNEIKTNKYNSFFQIIFEGDYVGTICISSLNDNEDIDKIGNLLVNIVIKML